MSAFADYRAAIAADIAIVKTLAETNTAALASAGSAGSSFRSWRVSCQAQLILTALPF